MQPSNIFIVVHVQNIYIYRWILWSSWWVMWRFTYITRGFQKHLYMSLYMHINLIYLCKLSFFKKENHGDLVLSIDFTVARRWLQSAFWWNWLCDMIFVAISFLSVLKNLSASKFSILLSDDSELTEAQLISFPSFASILPSHVRLLNSISLIGKWYCR
jgi:hypothetical protein